MLHRQFPELKISLYHLRLAYRQAGIKKKAIRIKKSKPPQNEEKINQETKHAYMELMEARIEGHRIIYCDEMCTTRSTIQKAEWSARRSYPKAETRAFHKKTVATIAAISQENQWIDLACELCASVAATGGWFSISGPRRSFMWLFDNVKMVAEAQNTQKVTP